MPTWDSEAEFWSLVVRHGLPRFRWLRRAAPVAQIDEELRGFAAWDELRPKIMPGDKIWPFRFPRSKRYWGKKFGYVVLRRNEFVGGVVTIVE